VKPNIRVTGVGLLYEKACAYVPRAQTTTKTPFYVYYATTFITWW